MMEFELEQTTTTERGDKVTISKSYVYKEKDVSYKLTVKGNEEKMKSFMDRLNLNGV